ncbi:RNA-binding protein 48 isoform X3 [Canis lupus dingo]|uniref:RNA-binding protein 48 isoform X3 n=1 Tax=Canis lupus dingo TaxID=286419 RepID=UPI0020C258C5|nr:RNA-binding protein 48 isoform X3 [Canis lupus dingo]
MRAAVGSPANPGTPWPIPLRHWVGGRAARRMLSFWPEPSRQDGVERRGARGRIRSPRPEGRVRHAGQVSGGAAASRCQDHYITKKKPVTELKDTKDFRQNFHSGTSGFRAVTVNTSAGNSDPCLPYSCELPLCYFSSKCTCSSGEHMGKASNFSQDSRNHAKTMEHCMHNDSLQKIQMKPLKNSLAFPGAQKAITSSEAVERFMPRTTQLQERKRRREDDRKIETFLETSTSSNEVMIGPLLPDIPKVDMHDDSLNTTANLIRNKLQEVISSVPKPPEDKLEDVHSSRPLKQRRRI